MFANYGTYTIKVTSTGYNTPLEFTFTYKADRTDLDKAIGAAAQLDQSAFTAVSWNAAERRPQRRQDRPGQRRRHRRRHRPGPERAQQRRGQPRRQGD
ncbi:MAG: hypothetical protein ACLU37_09400 [Collinsella sp.]